MPLSTGTRLGPYEIVSAIGAGGMGEVYKARDTRLNRDVAIKVLPANVANDPDRLSRFRREAQLLASLNHPNIAHIYGVEDASATHALVMELVPGRTLRELISAKRALPPDEAVAIARQIADALEAAHDAGVIHRDLKPANVKVRDDGTVKVLDFGLAKALDSTADSTAATVTSPAMTEQGVILGTAAYMSPEQAKGRPVDKRADIWAFGVVLFEMLSGERLVDGETVSETIAAVIKDPLRLERLPPATPSAVRRLVARCLERDPKVRLRDIGEARITLASADSSGSFTAEGPTPSSRTLARGPIVGLMAGAAALVMVAAAGGWYWGSRGAAAPVPTTRLVLPLGGDLHYPAAFGADVAVSPDGRSIVFGAYSGIGASQKSTGDGQLYLRALDGQTAQPLGPGFSPFWSPDGRWIAFYRDGKLKKMLAAGGPAIDIADNARMPGDWGPGDTIVFGAYADRAEYGIRRVSAAGGAVQDVTTLDRSAGQTHHLSPQLLPGGKAVLFTIRSNGPKFQLAVQPLQGGPPRVILENAAFGRYIGDGLLLYQNGTSLFVTRFDPRSFEISGAAPVLDDVANGIYSATWSFAAGTLIYRPADDSTRTLLWVSSRDGRGESLGVPPREYANPRLSPDGTRIATQISEGASIDAWMLDLGSGRLQPVTRDHQTRVPVWTADGKRLLVHRRASTEDLYVVHIDGSGPEEQVTHVGNSAGAAFVTRDGTVVYHEINPGMTYDLWITDLTGKTAPHALIATSELEAGARLHPSEQWIAYAAIRSGRQEVWVASFPDVRTNILVSTDGSREPVWSRDGRELFYRKDNKMFAVAFQPGNPPVLGRPRELFDVPYFKTGGPGNTQYDVAADGRFLMMKAPEPQLPHLAVVQGWTARLIEALSTVGR